MANNSNIYDISIWIASTSYSLNDIVYWIKDDKKSYYYCQVAHTASDFDVDYNANFWGGTQIFGNPKYKPIFIWLPSYNSDIDQTPKNKYISFGDGYQQRTKDGINNNLINTNLNFENRDLSEVTAINHFLYQRQGVESFYWVPAPPFNKKKLFICKNWNSVPNFYNNYSIKAKFEEVVV